MTKIYGAFYDSRNFSFEAFSNDERKAKATLIKGLRKHGRQYNCEPRWWYEQDVYVMEYKLNEPYRDKDTL
jgi:hypothetical protein